MHRTTILLPPELRREAENAARARGMTLSELIRQKLAATVAPKGGNRRQRDPLFRPGRLIETIGPTNVSARHDDYLYGKDAKPRAGKAAR